MRLIKYLARAGVASRRKCENIVKTGRIQINGEIVTNPYIILNPKDKVMLDEIPLKLPQEKVVILMNKPKGIITASSDKYHRTTVIDLIPNSERVFPVGRLDKSTTGALLLTNDGELTYTLTHPRYEIEKIYTVLLDKKLSKGDKEKIKRGVNIGKGEIGIAKVMKTWGFKGKKGIQGGVKLSMCHGKKREIRRMFTVLGYVVKNLHRESFAGIGLNGMSSGKWRKLTPKEMEELKQRVKKSRLKRVE